MPLHKSIVYLLATLTLSHPLSIDDWGYFILWNVGQGQWQTISVKNKCYHIDAGGEFWPKNAVVRLCRHKKNYFSFTHWDWDHIGFTRKVVPYFIKTCLLHKPAGPQFNPKKRALLKFLKPCSRHTPPYFEIHTPPIRAKNQNDYSRVFLGEFWLNSGDSTLNQEKIWENHPSLNKVRYYVLGHHGSYTSNGKSLFNKLRKVRQVLVSARYSRYGHPHHKVIQRVRNFKKALVLTENWGNIAIRF